MEVPYAENPQIVPISLLTGVCSVGSLKNLLAEKMKLQSKDFGFSVQLYLQP